MKVVGWVRWGSNYPEVSWEGGLPEQEAREAVIASIRENSYCFDGHYHQYGEHGAPLFDNGKTMTCSQRGWGGIMAEAWEIDDSDGFAYCTFAWHVPDKFTVKTPTEKDSN